MYPKTSLINRTLPQSVVSQSFRLLAIFVLGISCLSGPPAQAAAPTAEELEPKCKDLLVAFNNGLTNGDFTELYGKIAKVWQQQTDVQSLNQSFAPLAAKGFVGEGVADAAITFTAVNPPDPTGVVQVEGFLNTTNNYRILFSIKFYSEEDAWACIGINVNFAPYTDPATLTLPGPEELVQMVTTSMRGFDQALAAQSFAAFHTGLHPAFQNAVSPEQFAEIFQPFLSQGIRLESTLDNLEFTTTAAPAIDDAGNLVVIGFYPSTPARTNFETKYHPDPANGEWKLISINVNIAQE
ncbi:MAG: hypothetical protein ACFCU3_03170 [Verrucomicrobiales bacterium]